MPERKPPSVFVSLALLIAGAALALGVMHNHGWPSGAAAADLWKQLSTGTRAIIVIGLMASAYGLGGLVGNLARKQ